MRKMKKINGYLVVRFNDREKRLNEGTGLGSFGVIDAELYSGNLDIDRGVMEYDNAETQEEAVELARGLDSEFDVLEPEVKVTIVKETKDKTSEETFNPAKVFAITRDLLEMDLQQGTGEDIDLRTAAHELRGFVSALTAMGVVSGEDERFYVPLNYFDGVNGNPPQAAPGRDSAARPASFDQEDIPSHICDHLCKYRAGSLRQEELDTMCGRCAVGRWAADPPGALSAGEMIPLLQDRFGHLPLEYQDDREASNVYRLGKMLEEDSPDNDCTVYRNIFHMAKELDDALDRLTGYASLVVRRELRKRYRELREMYNENHAVGEYRKRIRLM